MTLQKLDLNVRSVAVRNLATPEAVPLALQDVTLKNEAPVEMGGKDAANRPPVKIALTGKVSPVVGSFQVALAATPFATTPAGTIEINAAGIRGEGVTELLPNLREHLKGEELVDGRFHASVQAQVKYDRRVARALRSLARVYARRAHQRHHLPQRRIRSGSRRTRINSRRSSAGETEDGHGYREGDRGFKTTAFGNARKRWHSALGFVIPVSTTQPTTQSAEPTVAQVPVEPAPEASPSPTTKPTGEIRVDRLTLSGLDVPRRGSHGRSGHDRPAQQYGPRSARFHHARLRRTANDAIFDVAQRRQNPLAGGDESRRGRSGRAQRYCRPRDGQDQRPKTDDSRDGKSRDAFADFFEWTNRCSIPSQMVTSKRRSTASNSPPSKRGEAGGCGSEWWRV